MNISILVDKDIIGTPKIRNNFAPFLLSALPTYNGTSCRSQPLCFIFVSVLQIDSWLLFCVASHKVIALPTIATAIFVTLLRSQRR